MQTEVCKKLIIQNGLTFELLCLDSSSGHSATSRFLNSIEVYMYTGKLLVASLSGLTHPLRRKRKFIKILIFKSFLSRHNVYLSTNFKHLSRRHQIKRFLRSWKTNSVSKLLTGNSSLKSRKVVSIKTHSHKHSKWSKKVVNTHTHTRAQSVQQRVLVWNW